MSQTKLIEVHIHSFSLRFQFKYRSDFDVFSFIQLAHREGFSGVNISANGAGYRDLGGAADSHFRAVRRELDSYGMKCEIDTSDTRIENLSRMLDVAQAVGAEQLRVYTRYQGSLKDLIEWTVQDLRAIAEKAQRTGINIVLENHEDFQGAAIARILHDVDHPRIRALFDYGNSQMVGEEPLDALIAMMDYITAVHVKDHVVVERDGREMIQGVPLGQGLLPVIDLTERLYAAGLRRFCFENVWGYVAPVIAGVKLPESAAFSKQHPQHYFNASDLPQAEALAAELEAFEQGWSWFKTNLHQAGFRMSR